MNDADMGIGFFLGVTLVGVPLAIGISSFLERSFDEGLRGAELAYGGIIFGRTRDGVLVAVASFKRGQQVKLRLQNLECKVYQLEQSYNELRAGCIVTQSRLDDLEKEVEVLRNEVSKIPHLINKVDAVHAEIFRAKKHIEFSFKPL